MLVRMEDHSEPLDMIRYYALTDAMLLFPLSFELQIPDPPLHGFAKCRPQEIPQIREAIGVLT